MSTKPQKGIDWTKQPLGACPDSHIAKRLGCSTANVRAARGRRGISTYREFDWSAVPLGEVPDAEIASMLGCSAPAVSYARRKRGIPSWTERRTCPCGTDFDAKHMRQKFCHYRCQRYHWQMTNRAGMTTEAADCAIAVWALKRTLKKTGVQHGME